MQYMLHSLHTRNILESVSPLSLQKNFSLLESYFYAVDLLHLTDYSHAHILITKIGCTCVLFCSLVSFDFLALFPFSTESRILLTTLVSLKNVGMFFFL